MVCTDLLKGSYKNAEKLPSHIPMELDFSSPLAPFPFNIRLSILHIFLYETWWLEVLKTGSFFSAMSSVISFWYLPEFTVPYLNIGCSPHVLDHSL